MSFDPHAHLTNIRGNDYLEVKWRIVWFREEHPAEEGWGIETEIVKLGSDHAVCRAEIVDPEGRVVATGTKSETKGGFADFIEKAETGAIGRALALLGYGTQWCAGELAEGARIVDSPVQNGGNGQQQPPPPAGPPDGLFDADGVPQNYKAVSYRLAELGVADSSRRKELVADAAAIVLGEDARPQTPADWYQVMQAAEDIALEEAEKAAQEAYA